MRLRVHYNQTYYPVAAWESISILLYTVLHNNWRTMQLNYMLDFTQEPVERECYMNITKGIEVKSDTEWVLNVKKNIYGQSQADRVWNKFIVEKLTSSSVGFSPSKVDECVF